MDSFMPAQSRWRQHIQPPIRQALAPVDVIYQGLLRQLQHDILILLISICLIASLPFSVLTFISTWIIPTFAPRVFFLHVFQIVVQSLGCWWLTRRWQLRAAWGLLFATNIGIGFIFVQLIGDPGMMIYTLLVASGAAIALSLWINLLLLGSIIIGTTLVVVLNQLPMATWPASAIIYASILIGMMSIGVVVRRFIRTTALQSLAREQDAVQRSSLEREIAHLHQRVRQTAMLKHDLRQPLRVVQGHLLGLEVSPEDQLELVEPGLAALKRAERLLSNLLDQAHEAAGQQRALFRPVDVAALLQSIEQTIPGITRYYTDPPVQVQMRIQPLPELIGDYEHLERAIFNLLDNALMHASAHIEISAWHAQEQIIIEIVDDGPGIPQQIIDALEQPEPLLNGFGLLQVKQALQQHQGSLRFLPTIEGTRIQVLLPCRKELR